MEAIVATLGGAALVSLTALCAVSNSLLLAPFVLAGAAMGATLVKNPEWRKTPKGRIGLGLMAIGTLAGGVLGYAAAMATGAVVFTAGVALSTATHTPLGDSVVAGVGFVMLVAGTSVGRVAGNILGATWSYKRVKVWVNKKAPDAPPILPPAPPMAFAGCGFL